MIVTFKDLPWVTTLERLRRRLIGILFVEVALAVVAWFFTPHVLEYLVHMPGAPETVIFAATAEAFVTRVKLAFALALVASYPFLLWQVRAVFVPLLSPAERRASLIVLPFSALLFYGGVAFALFLVLPLALQFLMSFAGEELEPAIRVANHVGFVIMFVVPFALVFQMPVVIVFLARLGVLTAAWLRRVRRIAIFVIALISAVLTPADVFSMVLMAIPMLLLYELSIVLAARANPGGETPPRSQ